MARRTIAVEEIEDVFAVGAGLWEKACSPFSYVSNICRDPGLTGLLWREVRKMIRWSRRQRGGLTDWQLVVLVCHLLGNSDYEIAERFDCARQTVQKARVVALDKISLYQPMKHGLLTVMLETFSWREVREHMADVCEEWSDKQKNKKNGCPPVSRSKKFSSRSDK
ncbi:hypothetical protein LLG46_02300 [bacterium]|nr:hypothetical protein [bacterium]